MRNLSEIVAFLSEIVAFQTKITEREILCNQELVLLQRNLHQENKLLLKFQPTIVSNLSV